jgi:hypothetical protein
MTSGTVMPLAGLAPPILAWRPWRVSLGGLGDILALFSAVLQGTALSRRSGSGPELFPGLRRGVA